MKKILLFKLKSICYNSTNYFIDCMAKELKALGCDVDIFDTSNTSLDKLNDLVGSSYDAIIDFNSKLPKLDMDEGGYFLDTIDAPFYNYLLDHPLYLHEVLNVPLKNYHVICLDRHHASYLRTYYPHLKSVHVLPLPGSKSALELPFSERKIEVLFSGTYTDPDHVLDLIHQYGSIPEKEMLELIDIMSSDLSLTSEDAFRIYLSNHNITLSNKSFAIRLHAYFLADTYMAAHYRFEILRSLCENNIPITLIGHGWSTTQLANYKNVRALSPIDFRTSFDKMVNAKIILNVMPWFKSGVHDRVFSALLNGAICCSDTSEDLNTYAKKQNAVQLFSLEQLNTLPAQINDLLSHPEQSEQMGKEGQLDALTHHTFKQRAKSLLDIINSSCTASDNPSDSCDIYF